MFVLHSVPVYYQLIYCFKTVFNVPYDWFDAKKKDNIRVCLIFNSEAWHHRLHFKHIGGIIMSAMASQITSLTIVYSIAYSSADQRKHQSSASLTFVRGIHWWPVNSPHKGPVTRKMLPSHIFCLKSEIWIILWWKNIPIPIGNILR